MAAVQLHPLANTNNNTINLVAAPVNGATCKVLILNTQLEQLEPRGTPQQTIAGVASFTNFTYTGPALIECSGGSYTDEATKQLTPLTTLTAVVSMTSSGSYAVTPLTDMAFKMAIDAGLGDMDDVLESHNQNIADQFGLEGIDITTTTPTANNYGLVLAALSQIGSDRQAPLDAVIDSMVAEMANAFLNSTTTMSIQTAIDGIISNPNFNGSFTSAVVSQVKGDVGTSSIDTIKSTILVGEDEVEYGSDYSEPGVVDNSGETPAVTTAGTVGDSLGRYTLTYTATDSSSNY